LEIDQLVAAVRAGSKYGAVCEDFIRNLGARELSKRGSLKEAVKATKNKLHQVAGVYLPGSLDYARWMAELQAAAPSGEQAIRDVCARIMACHVSSRERLGVLGDVYTTALQGAGPVRRVLDVACGLNPLALPWMCFPRGVEYVAYDIYEDMMQFVDAALAVLGARGQASVRDVLASPPSGHFDLALVLKTIPCLEQVDKLAAVQLLEAIDADWLMVSFPVHSVGGRQKGMQRHYESHFRQIVAGKPWQILRYEFTSELIFMVRKKQL